MSTQVAEAELADRGRVEDLVPYSAAGFGENDVDEEWKLSAARGIAIAGMISLPFWGLIVFTVYILL